MLKFKDIKGYAWTLKAAGPQQFVFPAPYDDLLKSDSIGELFFPRGMVSLSNWLREAHSFKVPPAILETITFSHLLDMVNPPKIDTRQPTPYPESLWTENFTPPKIDTRQPDAVAVNIPEFFADGEPEFLDGGYPNPLFCKDELYKLSREIMMKKNHDYRGGSGDPYANFRGSTNLGVKPVVGILLRVQDKIQRIRTFSEKGKLAVENESVQDSLIDIQNYMDLIWGLIKEMSHDSK
jgi:hypothetical protein